jgi:hypothetical protein
MTKITFLFSGNFDVEGQPRHYEKGAVDTVPAEDAERLIGGKCAELYVEKSKEVKHERKNK